MMDWRYEWRDSAECATTDNEVRECFFPDSEHDSSEDMARKELNALLICSSCVVREECLQFALETNEHYGIWGMHTQADRRELKRWMTRHPDKLAYHWDRSFRKVEARLASALDAEAAEGMVFAAVEFGDRLIEDEALVVG